MNCVFHVNSEYRPCVVLRIEDTVNDGAVLLFQEGELKINDFVDYFFSKPTTGKVLMCNPDTIPAIIKYANKEFQFCCHTDIDGGKTEKDCLGNQCIFNYNK